MKTLYLIVALAILVSSCATTKKKVDLIITNAKVYTVNDKFELAESFAIKDGKFMAIGTNDEI